MATHPKSNPVKPISDESFKNIVDKLRPFLHVTEELTVMLRPMLFEVTYAKGSNILSPGAKQDVVWFVMDGLLQEVNVDKHTYAINTRWFWFNLEFVYTIPGFFDQESSLVSIQVARATNVVFISHGHWKTLKDTFAEIDQLTEKIRSGCEMARQSHANDIIYLSTTERYLKYEMKLNILFSYVQLKYIAQYMGMSTDTLGRLRSRYQNDSNTRRLK